MREFRPCPKPPPREKKPKKPIPKRSKKKLDEIRLSKEYYQKAIEANIQQHTNKKDVKQNQICKCDECFEKITSPSGANVCHIIGMGANKKLYFEPINHFILCLKCADIEQNGPRKSMKIYPEWEKRRLQLLQLLIPEHRK